MNLGRVLATGIGGWLQLEHLSFKSTIFSEKYLAYPIGQLLIAHFGAKAHAEVKHSILEPFAKGKREEGRKLILQFWTLIQRSKSPLRRNGSGIGS
jgi:hypothetical protein